MCSWPACRTTTSATSSTPTPTPTPATSRARASTASGAGSYCGMPRWRCSPASARRPKRDGGDGLLRGELAGERGLPAGGGVAVEDAPTDRLVDGADRLADGVGRRGAVGGASVLHGGANLAADGAIAQAPLLVLLHALPS